METAKVLIGISLTLFILATTQVAMCKGTTENPLVIYSESSAGDIQHFIAHSSAPLYQHSKIDTSDLTMGWKTNIVANAIRGNFWGAVWSGLFTPSKCYSY